MPVVASIGSTSGDTLSGCRDDTASPCKRSDEAPRERDLVDDSVIELRLCQWPPGQFGWLAPLSHCVL